MGFSVFWGYFWILIVKYGIIVGIISGYILELIDVVCFGVFL